MKQRHNAPRRKQRRQSYSCNYSHHEREHDQRMTSCNLERWKLVNGRHRSHGARMSGQRGEPRRRHKCNAHRSWRPTNESDRRGGELKRLSVELNRQVDEKTSLIENLQQEANYLTAQLAEKDELIESLNSKQDDAPSTVDASHSDLQREVAELKEQLEV